MTDFYFTHDWDFYSSAVESAFYSANDETLAVLLHGVAYKYDGVPFSRYQELVEADSVGRSYIELRKSYGPAERLEDFNPVWAGANLDLDEDEVEVYEPPTAALGTPKGLTFTPEGVSYGDNVIRVDGSGFLQAGPLSVTNTSHIPLYSDTPDSKRLHTVHFDVLDGNDSKSYDVEAESVDEAVEGLYYIAGAFGLEVSVKGVYVSFE